MLDGKTLIEGYSRAGNDFLADRLEGLFRLLKSPEDIALHNAIVQEVLRMVGLDKGKANRFYRLMAGRILDKEAGKRFRTIIAEAIIGGR